MDKVLHKVTEENIPEYSAQDIAATINGEAEITEEDINKTIKKAKNNKAPWPGNTKMGLLKYRGERIVSFTRKLKRRRNSS